MGQWVCCYNNSFEDKAIDIPFDGNSYFADKVEDLPGKYNTPSLELFALGVSSNGDKAIMFNIQSFSGQVTGSFEEAASPNTPYSIQSVNCDIIGGRPKPPNKPPLE